MLLQCLTMKRLNSSSLRRMKIRNTLIALTILIGLAMFTIHKQEDHKDKDITKTQITEKVAMETLTAKKHSTEKPDTPKGFPSESLFDTAILKGRKNDECVNYDEAGRTQRTVHLDVLNKENRDNRDTITLVTQLSSSRYDKLHRIVIRWSGPISATVYMNKSTTVFEFTKQMQSLLAPRKNIALHLVSEKGIYFPVNFLRNVALENADTKYVLLTDVDFEPMPQLDIYLQDYISNGYLQGKTALVVPVFEALYKNITFPEHKHDVLKLWKTEEKVIPFHFKTNNGKEVATAGHEPTHYHVWVEASKPYNVTWKENYEPYVVVEKTLAPKYWPYLVSRFFDKASHLEELFAMGFNFVVLPDVFMVHTPHVLKPGTSLGYRCGQKEYIRFKTYLRNNYGGKIQLLVNAS